MVLVQVQDGVEGEDDYSTDRLRHGDELEGVVRQAFKPLGSHVHTRDTNTDLDISTHVHEHGHNHSHLHKHKHKHKHKRRPFRTQMTGCA